MIAFCPLASGLLTGRYLDGEVPADSRAAREWASGYVNSTTPAQRATTLQGLAKIANDRGQSLAQFALAWILRSGTVTSALVGASRVEQLEENVRALDQPTFSTDELARIDALTAG